MDISLSPALTSTLDRGKLSVSRLGRFTPPGKQLRYRRLGGLQSRSGNFGVQLIFSPLPRFQIRTVQFVVTIILTSLPGFISDVVIKFEVPDTVSAVSQVLPNQPATDALNKEHISITGKFLFTNISRLFTHHEFTFQAICVSLHMCTKDFTT